VVKEEYSMLQKIRNTWQFANLYQWICLFGKVVKIDDNLDIDVSTFHLRYSVHAH